MERKHVLVVDDDLPTLVFLQKLLTNAGYRVSAVTDSRQALKIVRDDQPSLAILDLIMPGMDGYTLCSTLKRIATFRAPVVVLSGAASPKDVQAAQDAGADFFMHKPVKADELLAKVAELVNPPAK